MVFNTHHHHIHSGHNTLWPQLSPFDYRYFIPIHHVYNSIHTHNRQSTMWLITHVVFFVHIAVMGARILSRTSLMTSFVSWWKRKFREIFCRSILFLWNVAVLLGRWCALLYWRESNSYFAFPIYHDFFWTLKCDVMWSDMMMCVGGEYEEESLIDTSAKWSRYQIYDIEVWRGMLLRDFS